MRPSPHRSPTAHPRNLFITLSLLAFSLNGATALAATQQPAAPAATDGTNLPEPPPFIETTGHGLAPYIQQGSPVTSTSTSSSATSGEPTTKDTLSSPRATKTSTSSLEQLSPVERYFAWLYGLLGME